MTDTERTMDTERPDDELYSVGEAARRLGMNPEVLRRRARNGEINFVKFGPAKNSPMRFRPSHLAEYIDAHEQRWT